MVDKIVKSFIIIYLGNKNLLIIFEVFCLLYKRFLVSVKVK